MHLHPTLNSTLEYTTLFKLQSNNANSTLFSSQLKNRRPSWTLHTLMPTLDSPRAGLSRMHKITLHAFQKKTFMQQDFLTQKNPIFHACTQTLGRCTNDSNSTQLLGINHIHKINHAACTENKPQIFTLTDFQTPRCMQFSHLTL
jgi:hypothetical protein